MIIRARCIQPIGEDPIDNGAIVVDKGFVSWVGRWRDCEGKGRQEVQDLGEVALLPGLVNAHCHLDFTKMAGKIPPPRHFPDWVKTILSLKAHWGYSDFAESWLEGAAMLVSTGTTTVCDIESYPELLPETWQGTPLRVFSFLEMTGVKDQRQPAEVLHSTLENLDRISPEAKHPPGLSPHALYSTTPELLRITAAAARERELRISMHVAESEAEFLMFREARGPFYDWLKGQRKMADCGSASPVELLERYGLLELPSILAHVNYLAAGDEERLARHGAAVAHCPRSHAYFGHHPFPVERLEAAGVKVCLATDSLATVLKTGETPLALDLWQEMRLFSARYPGVRPGRIFEMVTVNPAEALGCAGELGQIREKAAADFVAVNYTGRIQSGPLFESVLHETEISAVFIAGEVVHAAAGPVVHSSNS